MTSGPESLRGPRALWRRLAARLRCTQLELACYGPLIGFVLFLGATVLPMLAGLWRLGLRIGMAPGVRGALSLGSVLLALILGATLWVVLGELGRIRRSRPAHVPGTLAAGWGGGQTLDAAWEARLLVYTREDWRRLSPADWVVLLELPATPRLPDRAALVAEHLPEALVRADPARTARLLHSSERRVRLALLQRLGARGADGPGPDVG